jgi:hypothetical protein
LKEHQLAQLDKVLYIWFTAVASKAKAVTWSVLIGKAKSCCDEMKISK